MASAATSAPACASSSGNASSFSASRRHVLGFAAAAVAVPAAIFPSQAKGLVTSQSDRWTFVKAQFEAARAAVEAFEDGIYRPSVERLNKMTGPAPESRVTLTDKSGTARTYSVYDADELPDWRFYDPVRIAAVSHAEWVERVRAAEVKIGWDAIEDRMRLLDSAEGEARQHLMAVPAPDAAALVFKLRLALEGENMDDDREVLTRDATSLSA